MFALLTVPLAAGWLLSIASKEAMSRVAAVLGLAGAALSVLAAGWQADDWVLARRLGNVPANRLTATSDARLSALLARVLERPEPEARINLLKQASVLAINDPSRAFLAAVRSRLKSVYADECGAAMMALLYRQEADDLDAFEDAVRAIRSDPASLSAAAAVLHKFPFKRSERWLQATRRLDAALADDVAYSPMRLLHLGPMLDAEGRVALIEELGEGGALHFDAMVRAERLLALNVANFPYELKHAERLASSDHVGCRRAALWVLGHRVRRLGWIDEHKVLLARLQRDADPGVRGVALRTLLPREDELES